VAGLAALPWLFPALALAAPVTATADDAAVAQVVLAIMSYTRWPDEHPALHLCVLAAPQWAGGLLQQTSRVGGHAVLPQRLASLDDAGLTLCDVIYTGAISEAESRALSERLSGHPVLSISEDDADCVGGSMFCLNVRAGRVSFLVNLDSVSRSGVRVNPSVLELGHRLAGPPGKGTP
jgi:YfiR/HmsC-like